MDPRSNWRKRLNPAVKAVRAIIRAKAAKQAASITQAGSFPDAALPKIAGHGYQSWNAGKALQGVGIFGQFLRSELV